MSNNGRTLIAGASAGILAVSLVALPPNMNDMRTEVHGVQLASLSLPTYSAATFTPASSPGADVVASAETPAFDLQTFLLNVGLVVRVGAFLAFAAVVGPINFAFYKLQQVVQNAIAAIRAKLGLPEQSTAAAVSAAPKATAIASYERKVRAADLPARAKRVAASTSPKGAIGVRDSRQAGVQPRTPAHHGAKASSARGSSDRGHVGGQK